MSLDEVMMDSNLNFHGKKSSVFPDFNLLFVFSRGGYSLGLNVNFKAGTMGHVGALGEPNARSNGERKKDRKSDVMEA